MATQTNKIFINEDGVDRELTGAELTAFLKDRESMQALSDTLEAARAEKEAKRLAVLEKLGLTADEVSALI